MLTNGVWISILFLVFLTYLVFVFLAENTNPFMSPKRKSDVKRLKRGHIYRRWRLGKSVARSFLVASICVVILPRGFQLAKTDVFFLFAIIGCFFTLSVLFAIFQYVGKSGSYASSTAIQEDIPTEQIAEEPESEPPTAQFAMQARTTEIQSDFNPAIASDQVATNEDPLAGVSATDEHELEIELATSHIDPRLEDFDLSIAEADYRSIETSDFQVANLAKPKKEVVSSESLYVSLMLNTDEDDASENFMGVDESDRDSLLQKVKAQNEEIQFLNSSNKSLAQSQEQLEDTVAQMKYAAQKRDALIRKSQAELEHAVEIKNKAIALASAERKRRRLVEVRARKALIKYQQVINKYRLESEGAEA